MNSLQFVHQNVIIMQANNEYGLSNVTALSYQPYFQKYVHRFGDQSLSISSAAQQSVMVTHVPKNLLNDAIIARFLEEEWADGIPDGTFKRVRAALQSAHKSAGLGEIDWDDSARFPEIWRTMKVSCCYCLLLEKEGKLLFVLCFIAN